MKYQDVISIEPSIFKYVPIIVNDPSFRDDNIVFLRTILRQKGPMTVKDIVEEFKNNRNKKSDKTIYRYLSKLTDVGIVSKIGKRVFVDENNNIRTEALYGNSAYLFLIGIEAHPFSEKAEESILEKREQIAKVIGLFLQKQLGAKKINEQCFKKFLVRRHTNAQKKLIEIIEAGDEEIHSLVKELEYFDTGVILEVVSWLGSILDNPSLVKELEKCFK